MLLFTLPYRHNQVWLLFVVTACMLATGCEANVSAVLPTDAPFTMYGVLTPEADTQWVRIFPIEETMQPETRESRIASVLSVDLTTSQELSWEPIQDHGPDIPFGYLYAAPFAAEFTHRYRIDVTRDDGAISSVEVTIPSEAIVTIGHGTTSYPVTIPVEVSGSQMRLLNIRVEYTLDYRYATPVSVETPPPDPLVSIDYANEALPTSEGWLVPINLSADFTKIILAIQARSGAQINRLYGLRLNSIALAFIAASSDWDPPGGEFDPELLVQPGTLSNVTNGFGFVGAGYSVRAPWIPPDDVVRAAGYLVPRDTTAGSYSAQ